MASDVLAGHTVELCSSKGGYEVTPQDPREVNLDAAREAFEERSLPIVTDAGVLLIVDAGEAEVSVFESGRLLAKTTDEDEARAAARRVIEALEVTR